MAGTLEKIGKIIKPSITTQAIADTAEETLKAYNAEPAFKGYRGFPGAVCVSLNEEVVHGIPSKTRYLVAGDIVGVDIGVFYKDMYTDACRTFPVGEIDAEKTKLLQVTEKALSIGIAEAKTGVHVSNIGFAIQNYAESMGFSVVRDLVGHGVGKKIHEPPQIPHYGPKGAGVVLEENMTIAIEPMINAGKYQVKCLDDKWTYVTADNRPSAHFENTIAITASGPEILTKL